MRVTYESHIHIRVVCIEFINPRKVACASMFNLGKALK